MKKLITLSALALATTLTGCASIVGDSEYPVTMMSEPSGAKFEVRNNDGRLIHYGTTPNTVTLKSGAGYFKAAEYKVSMKKDGYQDQQSNMKGSISGWYWGNIIFGGLIGMLAVDPATGAMYKLPESQTVTLSPLAMPEQAAK